MSDVNRDPIRWERSMTQDADGQYVSYHDYTVLIEEYDRLRAELSRYREWHDAVMAQATRSFPEKYSSGVTLIVRPQPLNNREDWK